MHSTAFSHCVTNVYGTIQQVGICICVTYRQDLDCASDRDKEMHKNSNPCMNFARVMSPG